jgi:hypothetical protein
MEPTFVVDPNLTMENLKDTHRYLVTVEAETKDQVYSYMQGENWSPNGEMRPVIIALHLHHTSMSVGDVLVTDVNDKEIGLQVAPLGWKLIPRFRKPRVKNLGAIVGMFQKIAESESLYYCTAIRSDSTDQTFDLIAKHHNNRRNETVNQVKKMTGLPFVEIGKEICNRTSGKWVYYNLNW